VTNSQITNLDINVGCFIFIKEKYKMYKVIECSFDNHFYFYHPTTILQVLLNVICMSVMTHDIMEIKHYIDKPSIVLNFGHCNYNRGSLPLLVTHYNMCFSISIIDPWFHLEGSNQTILTRVQHYNSLP
jgi:hypothetical protein